MTADRKRVNEVYARLASILQRPLTFGLGTSAPQALTQAIEEMLLTLGEVNANPGPWLEEGDLEEELSQDADRYAYTFK